jgi:predicted glycosyltransferase
MEAAMLGTPSIRFSDFSGRISVLEELEHKYGLTFGFKTNESDKFFNKIDELLKTKNIKKEWQRRRQKMLAEKIDVTAFMAWLIENYPESVRIMKENPGYQYRFK